MDIVNLVFDAGLKKQSVYHPDILHVSFIHILTIDCFIKLTQAQNGTILPYPKVIHQKGFVVPVVALVLGVSVVVLFVVADVVLIFLTALNMYPVLASEFSDAKHGTVPVDNQLQQQCLSAMLL